MIEGIYDFIGLIYYRIVYKSVRRENFRSRINRFTGHVELLKVYPLARLGVDFTPEQTEVIKDLVENKHDRDAQEIVLTKLQEEDLFPFLPSIIKMNVNRARQNKFVKDMQELIRKAGR